MKETIVEAIADWEAVVKDILDEIEVFEDKATVIALSGDLGSGKTTLVQQIAKKLNIKEMITSPTFNILKQYQPSHPDFDTLFHMDAYRLESEVELAPLQFNAILEKPKTLFCIEWAEKIKSALPSDTVFYQLKINDKNQHTIQKVS